MSPNTTTAQTEPTSNQTTTAPTASPETCELLDRLRELDDEAARLVGLSWDEHRAALNSGLQTANQLYLALGGAPHIGHSSVLLSVHTYTLRELLVEATSYDDFQARLRALPSAAEFEAAALLVIEYAESECGIVFDALDEGVSA